MRTSKKKKNEDFIYLNTVLGRFNHIYIGHATSLGKEGEQIEKHEP